MFAKLHYGAAQQIDFDLPDSALIAACGMPAAKPLADPQAAAAAALAAPRGFPPLAQATVPGDRVVLALEQNVPQAGAMIAAIFEALIGRGLSPEDITLLTPAVNLSAANPRDLVPAEFRKLARFETHDPDSRDHLSYLAADDVDEPIYVNRSVCDADVVVPVGCVRAAGALDYHGLFGGLFPTFAGRKLQDKLFAENLAATRKHEAAQQEMISKVGWLLGVQFTLQVVPGPGGTVLDVLAGLPSEVYATGEALYARHWKFQIPQAAPLVIAAIDGAAEQTWDNVARALDAASRVVAPDGAIAICSSLKEPPGETLRQFAAAADARAALKRIYKQRANDSLPAAALVRALSQARVYFLSQLDEATVEELGMAPVANGAEMTRLAKRFDQCVLIDNAQYALVATEGD